MNAPTPGKPSFRPSEGRKGFTLIEMLLVLVILASLAAVVVPRLAGRGEQAKVTAALSQINVLETALDAFEVDNGYFPQGGNGLDDLVEAPRSASDWRGPYLKRGVPADPWGNDYQYDYPGKHNSYGYDLLSMGPDGREGGDDDITNYDE